MSTWRKAMGSGAWPLYFDKESLNATFGRFCLQPLPAATAAYLADSLRNAMAESLPGAAIIGFSLRLNHAREVDGERKRLVMNQVKDWLKDLRITTAASFPLVGRLRQRGPGLVHPTRLGFEVPVQVVTTPAVSIELLADEGIELEFVFHWGRGGFPAAQGGDLGLPKGWIAMEGNHSPVKQCRLSATPIDVGPHRGKKQLIAEITTDGTLSPEDAIRRAGRSLRLPPQPLAG